MLVCITAQFFQRKIFQQLSHYWLQLMFELIVHFRFWFTSRSPFICRRTANWTKLDWEINIKVLGTVIDIFGWLPIWYSLTFRGNDYYSVSFFGILWSQGKDVLFSRFGQESVVSTGWKSLYLSWNKIKTTLLEWQTDYPVLCYLPRWGEIQVASVVR